MKQFRKDAQSNDFWKSFSLYHRKECESCCVHNEPEQNFNFALRKLKYLTFELLKIFLLFFFQKYLKKIRNKKRNFNKRNFWMNACELFSQMEKVIFCLIGSARWNGKMSKSKIIIIFTLLINFELKQKTRHETLGKQIFSISTLNKIQRNIKTMFQKTSKRTWKFFFICVADLKRQEKFSKWFPHSVLSKKILLFSFWYHKPNTHSH